MMYTTNQRQLLIRIHKVLTHPTLPIDVSFACYICLASPSAKSPESVGARKPPSTETRGAVLVFHAGLRSGGGVGRPRDGQIRSIHYTGPLKCGTSGAVVDAATDGLRRSPSIRGPDPAAKGGRTGTGLKLLFLSPSDPTKTENGVCSVHSFVASGSVVSP